MTLSFGDIPGGVAVPRFKMFKYKHTHDCAWKDQEYEYRPATQGAVMFPITPRCVETNVDLELIEVVDE